MEIEGRPFSHLKQVQDPYRNLTFIYFELKTRNFSLNLLSLNFSYVDDYRIYNLWKLNLIRLIFQFVKILIFSIRDRLSSIIQALPITGRLFWINTATHVQKLYIRKASWSIFIRSFTVNWQRGRRFRVTTVDISLTERKKIS